MSSQTVNNPDWSTVVIKAKAPPKKTNNPIPGETISEKRFNTGQNTQFQKVNARVIERRLEDEDANLKPKGTTLEFRTELQRARQTANFTQKQLATACNLPESSIKSFENGSIRPTGQDLNKINRVLKTKIKLNK